MSFKSVCAAASALAALIGASATASADAMKIIGTFDGTITQQQAHPLSPDGKVIVSELGKGSTKTQGPLDGAEMLVSENLVLDKGNGIEQGSVSYANEKGSITSEIHGKVTTVMVGGQPKTTASGTYKMVSGTGIFAGGEGYGTFTVAYTSKTDFKGEYKGVLKLPKRQAAR